jgi:hypothetical protein
MVSLLAGTQVYIPPSRLARLRAAEVTDKVRILSGYLHEDLQVGTGMLLLLLFLLRQATEQPNLNHVIH